MSQHNMLMYQPIDLADTLDLITNRCNHELLLSNPMADDKISDRDLYGIR